MLEGYVLGVETAYRIGHSTYPTHYENGWHSTGTVGVFGAAAAGASIRGLSQSQTEHAFGISASSSSALKKNFGSMTKPLHAGHAAAMGLRSVLLSERGFTADSTVLEGAIGYGAAMTSDGAYDPSAITDGLEKRWAVDDIGFKPYPSGVITHAAMDAFRDLVQEHELGPDGIESVTVTLDEAASEMLIHENPSDALQAKFSIKFCLAAVLRVGDPDIRAFSDDYVTDSVTREAMAPVERDFEPNLFDGSFANYGARITVETVSGETHVAEERYASGTPTNHVSEERLREKYSAYESITVAIEVGIANIEFHRPEKYNALSTEVMLDLQRAFCEIQLDRSINVVVVIGEGEGFLCRRRYPTVRRSHRDARSDVKESSRHLVRFTSGPR